MTYKPKEGDFVRVTLEGSVYVTVCGAYLDFNDNPDIDAIDLDDKSVKSIEKIEEPLKLGDLCWFWGYKRTVWHIGYLREIHYKSPYEYVSDNNDIWPNAEKIPEPLATQLKELYFND